MYDKYRTIQLIEAYDWLFGWLIDWLTGLFFWFNALAWQYMYMLSMVGNYVRIRVSYELRFTSKHVWSLMFVKVEMVEVEICVEENTSIYRKQVE